MRKVLALCLALPSSAVADEVDELTDEELLAQSIAEAEVIEVEDRAPAEAASSVHFTLEELRMRPAQTASDLLRQTPGLAVVQHAGGGKADQYFLRGFDADHGTDVALFADGVPINLTSHAHGQGYADAHWLIPETIASIDVHKGPYAARYGDFYTAAAIEMKTIDSIDRPTLWLTGGTQLGGPVAAQRLSSRMVGMATPQVGGGQALFAAEVSETDGPFLNAQDFRRGTVNGKWKRDVGPGKLRLATTFYAASWNQSGQIPETEVREGRLDRFGTLDASEGGQSMRASVAAGYTVERPGSRWRVDAYAVNYSLQLFSNFTLYARDVERGDQIEQTDDRMMYGVSGSYQRSIGDSGPVLALVTLGTQARFDSVDTGLWHTATRQRLADCFANMNPCNQTGNSVLNAAVYAEGDIGIHSKLHFLPGLRVDQFAWAVADRDAETRGTMTTMAGSAQRAIVSPKLSTVLHASKAVDVFVNGGRGFHSNDARAAVSSRGEGALASAWGAETGMRVHPMPGLRSSFAAWYLQLSSEQVWSGDFGTTEPSDPSQRFGIDAEISWLPIEWLSLDANVAVARSTYAPAPRLMGGAGIGVQGASSRLSLRARGIDRRPANEDATLVAAPYCLLDLVAAKRVGRAELMLTVNNLLDAAWREAQFAEESRVTPTSEVREDLHFTPGMPLTALLTLAVSY